MNSLENIAHALGADSAAVMVPDLKQRHCYCYESYNMPREWTEIKNSFDEDVPGGNVEVYQTGKPAITNHLSTLLQGHHIESVMIVPVIVQGETAAMLEVVRRQNKRGFTDAELAKAIELATGVAQELASDLRG